MKSFPSKYALEIYDHKKYGQIDALYMNHEFFQLGSKYAPKYHGSHEKNCNLHTLNHFKFFVGPQLVLNQYDFLFDIDDWEILDPCSTVFQAGITEH